MGVGGTALSLPKESDAVTKLLPVVAEVVRPQGLQRVCVRFDPYLAHIATLSSDVANVGRTFPVNNSLNLAVVRQNDFILVGSLTWRMG